MVKEKIAIVVYTKEGGSWQYVAKAKCKEAFTQPSTQIHLRDRDWIVTDSLPRGTFPEDRDAIRVLVRPK